MTGIVIAFAGQIGSGKTSISKELSELLEWPRVGFGDYVRAEASRRGFDPECRDVLQSLGEQLVAEDPTGFCQAVLGQAGFTAGENIVVDGIRHIAILECLSELARPSRTRLFYLDVNATERRARLSAAEKWDAPAIERAETHSTEADLKEALPRCADAIIDANEPMSKVLRTILHWLEQFGVYRSKIEIAISRLHATNG